MEPICKGAYVLGTACGGCSRCREDWARRRAQGWRLIPPNTEIMDATTATRIAADKSAEAVKLDTLRSLYDAAVQCLATYVADEDRHLKGGEAYCIPTECGMHARMLTAEVMAAREAKKAADLAEIQALFVGGNEVK